MKHFVKALPLALLIWSSGALGRPIEDQACSINVGPTFNFARYKFGDLPKTQGYLAGIHADFTHDLPCHLWTRLRFDGRWNAGFVCSKDGVRTKIQDYRPQWDLGYNFALGRCENFELAPFAGLGFFYLSNKFKTEDNTFRYLNLYVPIGLHANWIVHEDCFEVGLSTFYRIDAWTRLKVKTPDLEQTNKLKLKRTQGLLVELPLTWYHEDDCRCANFQTRVVPFFDWNRFGKTKEKNENGLRVPVPKLQQWYLGVHVDVGIRF